MANKKISALSSASLPLAGTEVLPIVQSSSTVKVATDDLTVKNVRSNATTGILQIAGPGTGTTRVMTTPNANFTAARTDAAQTFSGVQTFSNQVNITGAVASGAANAGVFANSSGQFQTWVLGANTSTYGTYVLVQALSDLSSSRQLLSFDTSGNGSFDSGNVAFATAAKGINFTANTGAAGKTSQLLNWYEEGTWTPNDQSGAGLSFTVTSARYTRIGRQVTVQFDITFPTTVSTATQLMGGLPFVAGAQNYGGFVTYTTHANALDLLLYTSGGVSYISYRIAAGGSNNTNAAYSGNIIRGVCVYFI